MNEKIVLAGGCFDVLHPGHITFLEKAKKMGGFLIVLLESDEKIRKIKGNRRPVYSQKERAVMLKSLKVVDQVISLPFMEKEQEYDELVKKIKPDVIATTKGDPNLYHKKRAAKLVGARLVYVTKFLGNYSTTNILTEY